MTRWCHRPFIIHTTRQSTVGNTLSNERKQNEMAATIGHMISELLGKVFPPEEPLEVSTARPFEHQKELCEKDAILVAMFNSKGHEHVSYCICDPDHKDNPIIFASDGFCAFTGYANDEIEGRNCRFLQGKDTRKEDVDRIRAAVKKEEPVSVNLLNYRKDGTSFVNEFFMSPLRDESSKVLYFIGVQCQVSKLGQGQMPSNPAWVYTQGNHV
jgi:PAS domain S-box-containing protein